MTRAEVAAMLRAWLALDDDASGDEAHSVTAAAADAVRAYVKAGGDIAPLRRMAERSGCDLDGLIE